MDEAQAILETARKKNIGGTMVHFDLGLVAIARGDWTTLERENAMARQSWADPFPILQRDAQLAISRGQVRKARDAFQLAIESVNRQKLTDNEAATILEEITDELLL